MKIITFDQPGEPEVLYLAETEKPHPKKGEVLIQVKAAGVNRPDILQRKGAYAPPPGASPVLGLEVAGNVVECGAESGSWKVGDSVCALVSGGGYAEYCTAPAGQCLPIPKGLSFVEAAAIPETFFTVWANVFTRGRLTAGESLLIHGGSSGIGSTAIQMARAFGAKVFVTVGGEDKRNFCLQLGAAGAVNYRTEDFATEIRRLNSGQGIDVILDMVAGDYFSKNLDLLAPEGRLVLIATQKGELVNLSIRTLMSKGATITGSTLRPRSIEQKSKIASELREKIWPLLEAGKLKPIVGYVYPLSECIKAHRHMESSKHMGKIVLSVSDE
ncbi:MAG: NAD(P)H-quinone oxidoreductase [Bdellovibrionia bacterium]